MTDEVEKQQPDSIERLVTVLKRAMSSDEPTEQDLAELGESLLSVVKSALAGAVSN